MIERYTRPEMAELWSEQSRLSVWLEVETVALEEMAREGLVPRDAAEAVRARGGFDIERMAELERELKHDVIAFLTTVAEKVGPEARYLHFGMTSSDLIDTAFALQLTRATDLILAELDLLLEAVRARAEEHRHTVCIGRSHGIHAEPTTFGLKMLGWYTELQRSRARIVQAREEIRVGKLSGAVGTLATLPPQVEERVMQRLGLGVEPVATQVVARDRHAAFFSALALLGCAIERAGTEIRHLQRTEVREAEERFTAGQKGSSAMPHKRNPILSENLCGLARLLRSYADAALQNVALWHERDISHSSVERVIAPDSCTVAHFMLHRFRSLVEGLVVYPERMRQNLELTRGLPFSGRLLLALSDRGMTREHAYGVVQRHALAAWEGGPDLLERVSSDPEVTALLDAGTLQSLFSVEHSVRHVDYLFERVLSNAEHATTKR